LNLWLESLSVLRSRKYRDYTIISGRSGKVTMDSVKNQQAVFKSILGRMETLARKESPPEATGKMIPAILSRWKFPQKNKPEYTQRLQHGLMNYYINHHSPEEISQED